MNKKKGISQLDEMIIARMLDDYPLYADNLREQLSKVRECDTVLSGKGFYTNFMLQDNAVPLPGCPDLELGFDMAEDENIDHQVGFMLFVRNGLIQMLEGFSYGQVWPQEVVNAALLR